jgi:SAM-dependent methyltransferase
MRFPHEAISDRFENEVQALSAGCGTGRGAAALAMSISPLTLTAIDLSPASLSFAKRKFENLGLPSARFGIGDILNLDALDQTFDLIECSGVLHHMADPAAGLRALTTVLRADGIMRIALYSERARASVVAARRWLSDLKVSDTPDGVRQARSALRALPVTHPARGVIDTPEYFILSGLHDLIFNIQEHRFTPRQLKVMLDGAGLRLLGFDHANPAVASAYAKAHPNDPEQVNLDKWEVFEQNHPDVFAEMYQFWVRPHGV